MVAVEHLHHADATEMPRCFSISIQSLVAWRLALRPFDNGTGDLDRAREQQQLFRQRGLYPRRVGNDGKGGGAGFQGRDKG